MKLQPKRPAGTAAIVLLWIGLQLLLAGCWSRWELTDIALVTACAVDLAEDDLIEVTVVLEHPGHGAGGGMESGGKPTMVIIDSAKATSIHGAVTKLATHSSKKPYWSHASFVLIGEEMARHGIGPVLDWLDRDREPRRLMWLLVTPGKAKDIFIRTTAEPAFSPADLITHTIRMRDEASLALISNVHQFSKALATPGCDPVAGRLELTPGPDGALRPVVVGAAVFRGDKLSGWLSPYEARGLMWAQNKVKGSAIELPLATLEIDSSRCMVRVVRESGRPCFTIEVKINAHLGELSAAADVSRREVLDQIEQQAAEVVKTEIATALQRCQKEYAADAFCLGNEVHKHLPSLWHSIQGEWHALFSTVKVNIDVTVRVSRFGTIVRALLQTMAPTQ